VIWGFTVPKFHPDIASLFLQELILTFYVECQPALMVPILSNHTRLGSHSHIIVYLRNKIIYEYRWGHKGIRPFSMSLPFSCPKCGRLQYWKPYNSTERTIPVSVEIYCRGKNVTEAQNKAVEGVERPCPGQVTLRPTGIHRVSKSRGDATGEWYGKYIGRISGKGPLWWSYDSAGVLSATIKNS
jgi:hypothetical protein